jgi:hypothetical protein
MNSGDSLTKRAYLSHPLVQQAIKNWGITPVQYKLLDKVTSNWLLEENPLTLEQFRVKFMSHRTDFDLLRVRFVTETSANCYRPKFLAICLLASKPTRSSNTLLKTCNKVFQFLRRFYLLNVGKSLISLENLAQEISTPVEIVERALEVLGETSLSIYLNRQVQQPIIVNVQENILHYKTLWSYLVQHVASSSAQFPWASEGPIEGKKSDYYGDILAVVPDGRSLYERCMERVHSEPDSAITMARSLVESTLKWIAHDAGYDLAKNQSPSKLFELCLDAIGHGSGSIENALGTIELTTGMNQMLIGLAKLRNTRGNAHGRKPGQPEATRRHARLAALTSVSLALYLVEAWEAAK